MDEHFDDVSDILVSSRLGDWGNDGKSEAVKYVKIHKIRPNNSHPLFKGFVEGSLEYSKEAPGSTILLILELLLFILF